jgi:hypothetical protein
MLLCAYDAWLELADLGALRRLLAGARRGRIARGDGKGGALVTLAMEQAGRALDGEPRAIDASHGAVETRVHGGAVEVEGETIEIAEGAKLRVWLDDAAYDAAGALEAGFDAAFEQAEKPKGYARPLELSASTGDEVWIAGDERARMVSTIDPNAWTAGARRLLGTYIALHLAASSIACAVALSAPMDHWIAKLGGALCLACFLGSPPILRAVRARTRTPDERRRFWVWREPSAVAEAAAAG